MVGRIGSRATIATRTRASRSHLSVLGDGSSRSGAGDLAVVLVYQLVSVDN